MIERLGPRRRPTKELWVGFAVAVVAILGVSTAAVARGFGSAEAAKTTRPIDARGAVPVANALRIFSGSPSTGDRLPAAVAASFAALVAGAATVDEDLRPGVPRLAAARLLLSGLGADSSAFYAAPTSKGQVCLVVTHGPEGCTDRLPDHGVTWGEFDPDRLGSGDPIAVYGLAANDVVRVEVALGTRTERARLANNAFFFQPATPDAAGPTALIVTHRDGSAHRIPIPPPRSG